MGSASWEEGSEQCACCSVEPSAASIVSDAAWVISSRAKRKAVVCSGCSCLPDTYTKQPNSENGIKPSLIMSRLVNGHTQRIRFNLAALSKCSSSLMLHLSLMRAHQTIKFFRHSDRVRCTPNKLHICFAISMPFFSQRTITQTATRFPCPLSILLKDVAHALGC